MAATFAKFTTEQVAARAAHLADQEPVEAENAAITQLMLERMTADELRKFCAFISGYRREAFQQAREEWLEIHR